jgi:hypothetical protein
MSRFWRANAVQSGDAVVNGRARSSGSQRTMCDMATQFGPLDQIRACHTVFKRPAFVLIQVPCAFAKVTASSAGPRLPISWRSRSAAFTLTSNEARRPGAAVVQPTAIAPELRAWVAAARSRIDVLQSAWAVVRSTDEALPLCTLWTDASGAILAVNPGVGRASGVQTSFGADRKAPNALASVRGALRRPGSTSSAAPSTSAFNGNLAVIEVAWCAK